MKLSAHPDAVMLENRLAIWTAIRKAVKKYGARDRKLVFKPPVALLPKPEKPPKKSSRYTRDRSTWDAEDWAAHERFRFRARLLNRHRAAEKRALEEGLEVWNIDPRFARERMETAQEIAARIKAEKRDWLKQVRDWQEKERLRAIHEKNEREAEEARRAAERQRIRQQILDSYTDEDKATDAAIRARLRREP